MTAPAGTEWIPGGDVPDGLGRALPRGGPGPLGRGRRLLDGRRRGHQRAASPSSSRRRGTSRSPSARSTPPTSRARRPRTSCPARWSSRRTPRAGRPAPSQPVVGMDAGRLLEAPGGAWILAGRPRGPPRRARRLRGRRGLRRVGRASHSRPRPSGSTPPAAALDRRRVHLGRRARGAGRARSRTTGTATSRGARSPGTGRRRRSARFRRTATASSTWPATSGSGRPTGTRRATPRTTDKPCCVPRNPRGGTERDSLDPAQPQFRDRAQGHQGRLVPVRRQLLPALPARRAPAADDRHRHEPRRVPLRASGSSSRRTPPRARPLAERSRPKRSTAQCLTPVSSSDVLGSRVVDGRRS